VALPGIESPDDQDPDWLAFASLDRMVNHWANPSWPPGKTAYYWYLEFAGHPDVQHLARLCRSAVDRPEFDPVEPDALHMTIHGVGFTDAVSETSLREILGAAAEQLRDARPLELTIGPLAGSPGALSFSVSPRTDLVTLRNKLLAATRRAGHAKHASTSDAFRPHVGIGYCNSSIEAAPVIERVRRLRSIPRASARVHEVALVALTRHERAWSWETVENLRLPG
jgi:2'-5' RNA ligase